MKRKIGLGLAILFVVLGIGFLLFSGRIAGPGETANATMKVTDSTGRDVDIPLHPKRVVILNASNVDLYVAAGGGDNIAGIATSEAYSDEVKKAMANAKEVGIIHSPSVETILSLQPDLVIGTNVPFHQALTETLGKAGIPLYINSVNTFDDLYSSITLFGRLNGQEQVAEKKIADMKADYKAVMEDVKDRMPPKSLIIFGNPQSFNMATQKTFTGNLIQCLGGGNIADTINDSNAYIPLNLEFLTKENTEVIFIIMMGDKKAMEEKVRTELEGHPAWQNVKAVQNKRVYILPFNLFTINPGVKAIEALKMVKGYMYDK